MDKLFKTADTQMATVLIVMGNQLKNIEPSNSGKTNEKMFVFDDTDKLQDDIKKLLFGKVLLDPFLVLSEMRRLVRLVKQVP